jgi:hypothetical protein
MPHESLFSAANLLALAGWAALLAAPRSPLIAWRLAGLAIPGLLAAGYTAALLWHLPGAQGGFGSLAAVRALLSTDGMLLAGWIHYLAFDLFIGAWITRRAMSLGWPRWKAALCLPPTFLAGPAGLLLFLALGGGRGRAEALA